MEQQLICPSCKQPVEATAAFCGNCGFRLTSASADNMMVKMSTNQPTSQPLLTAKASPMSEVYGRGPTPSQPPANLSRPQLATNSQNSLPSYAVAYPHPHQHRAAIGLAAGIVGIAASILLPILGIGLGIFGIIMSTTSYKKASPGLKISSLIVSIVAIISGIAIWTYAIAHNPAYLNHQPANSSSSSKASLSVNTPCYNASFTSQFNISNTKGSCSMSAYNGATLANSSNVYKVVASNVPGLNSSNFDSLTKSAIEYDLKHSLAGFSITGQASTTFAGDSAYSEQAYNASQNAVVVEEAVLHSSAQDNFFVIIHATEGNSTNLQSLQKYWKWND